MLRSLVFEFRMRSESAAVVVGIWITHRGIQVRWEGMAFRRTAFPRAHTRLISSRPSVLPALSRASITPACWSNEAACGDARPSAALETILPARRTFSYRASTIRYGHALSLRCQRSTNIGWYGSVPRNPWFSVCGSKCHRRLGCATLAGVSGEGAPPPGNVAASESFS